MSDAPRRFIRHAAPAASAVITLAGLIYVVAQQNYRHAADDPAIDLAHEAAGRLGSGLTPASVVPSAVVDLALGPSPFLLVVDEADHVLASSGRLHGEAPVFPAGALEAARTAGEDRVTWQPERGVRIATVAVAVPGRRGWVVVAGRSLAETERRISQLGQLVLAGLAAALLALCAAVAATEMLVSIPRAGGPPS